MYAIYVVSFILALIALSDLGGILDRDLDQGRAKAVASQMAAYHQAALRTCLAGCPSGTVNPDAELPGVIHNAPLYDTGDFRSVSDGSDAVWTYYRLSETERDFVEYGRVSRALARLQSVSAAPYDADQQEIVSGMIRDGTTLHPIVISVPNGVGGNVIPDGTPVIVTRLR